MHGLEDAAVALVTSTFASLGYVGVIVLMAIESACIPLPSEITLPLSGFLVAEGRFTFWAATLAGAGGGTIGSIVAYFVGYFGGRPLLLRYGHYVLINPEDAQRADRFFARYGEATAFFSRLLPVIRTFISLPAGITRMNFPRFLVYTFAGSLIWSGALVYAGMLLGRNWLEVRALLQRFDYLIGLVVVLAVAWYIYHHAVRRRSPQRELA